MDKIRAIVARPGEKAYVTEIEPSYEVLSELVGGHIEATYPLSNEVAVICDECGKLKGKMPNRLVYGKHTKEREDYDIYAGTIVIVRSQIELDDFTSLTDEQVDLYMDVYGKPQFKTDWGVGGVCDE